VGKKSLFQRLKAVFILILVVFAGLWAIRICNDHRFHVEKETRFMMDTYVTMYAVGPKEITSKAINLALDRMQQIDMKFNALSPKSPIYAFNNSGISISDPEILNLLQIALSVSRKSEGAFDITVASLAELWGFYSKSYRINIIIPRKTCAVANKIMNIDKIVLFLLKRFIASLRIAIS